MIISRIIKKSIFLRAIMLLTAAECSDAVGSPEYFNARKTVFNEYQSVIDAIKRCNPGVRFEPGNEYNRIIKAMDFIKKYSNADFTGQNLAKIPIHALSTMNQIKSLNISGNAALEFTSLDAIRLKDKKIAELIMSDCNLKVDWIKWLLPMQSLEKLDISHNDLASLSALTMPGYITTGVTIKDLSVAYCCIDFEGFKKMVSLFDNLTSLDISGNNSILENASEKERLDFGKLKKTLKSLKMVHVGFNKKWLEAINDLECLEHLDLSYNKTTISKMDEFAVTGLGTYNRTLISLKIDICGAVDAWLDEIGDLNRLESLYIGGDDIFKNSETSNHAFETFLRMKNLKTIVFNRCRFTEARKRDIRAALPNIQIEF